MKTLHRVIYCIILTWKISIRLEKGIMYYKFSNVKVIRVITFKLYKHI